MTPRFIYFDMGNVLLHFDHAKSCRQLAALYQRPYDDLWRAVFGKRGLQWCYERGELTSGELAAQLGEMFDSSPELNELMMAASNIFRLNTAIVPLLAALKMQGYRTGVFSNTCEAHWQFVTSGRYRILPGYFDVFALSYELKAMKPSPESYLKAVRLSGVKPQEILFLDDREENVTGARAAGLDAVHFTSAAQLARDFAKRGITVPH